MKLVSAISPPLRATLILPLEFSALGRILETEIFSNSDIDPSLTRIFSTDLAAPRISSPPEHLKSTDDA